MSTNSILVPLLDLKAQYLGLKEDIDEAIARVLHKGNYVSGEEVEAFEDEWARYCGAKYCVGISSCTDALCLTLKAMKLPKGSNILTTPLTFWSTTYSILHAGHVPVFWDVEPLTGNLNPHAGDRERMMENSLVMPVHLYGRPANLDYGPLPVVEDAAQAHGQKLREYVGCYSFYPSKNLGAIGQAGAIVTNDERLASLIKAMRNHNEGERFHHHAPLTGNHRMDELQAAILRVKLPHLDRWNAARRKIADCYRERLSKHWCAMTLPEDHPDHNYHMFVVKYHMRDELADYLSTYGIQTAIRYPILSTEQPGYTGPIARLPEAVTWAVQNLSLPIYPEMPWDDVEYVCKKIDDWFSNEGD